MQRRDTSIRSPAAVGMLAHTAAHAPTGRNGACARPNPAPPTDFGCKLAHDFRNLLLVADTRVETAQLDAAKFGADSHGADAHAELAVSLQAARTAIAELRALTHLLDGVRVQSRPAPAALDLCKLLGAAGKELRALLAPQVRVVVELPGESGLWVHGDAPQLRRMIRNLGLNAREAMPHGGTLTLGLRSTVDPSSDEAGRMKVRLIVRDSGAGIAPEARACLFDAHFTTRAQSGGSGLGLAIVREIAAVHAAVIEVESRTGEGTEFRIDFPAARSSKPALRKAAPANGRIGDTILAVSADPAVHALVRGALRDHTGQLRISANGRDALRVLEGEPHSIGCLVLDACTLAPDDLALLRALRAWRGRRGVVLIVQPLDGPVARSARPSEAAVMRSRVAVDLAGGVRRAEFAERCVV